MVLLVSGRETSGPEEPPSSNFWRELRTLVPRVGGTGSGPTPSHFYRTKNELLMWNLDQFQHTQCSRLSASCWQLTLIFFSLKWWGHMLLYTYTEKWMEGPNLPITPNLLKGALRCGQCLPNHSVAFNCVEKENCPLYLWYVRGIPHANSPGKDRTRILMRNLPPLLLSCHWPNSPRAYCLPRFLKGAPEEGTGPVCPKGQASRTSMPWRGDYDLRLLWLIP